MNIEQGRKLRDAPMPAADRLKGLVTLLNAEARLLAEYGGKAMIKDGPVKQAGQTLAFARTQVASAYIREMSAEIKGVSIESLESELNAASIAVVEELLGRPDKGISVAEIRSMDIQPKEELATADEITTMDVVDKMASTDSSVPF